MMTAAKVLLWLSIAATVWVEAWLACLLVTAAFTVVMVYSGPDDAPLAAGPGSL